MRVVTIMHCVSYKNICLYMYSFKRRRGQTAVVEENCGGYEKLMGTPKGVTASAATPRL